MDFNWRSPVLPRVAFLAASVFLFCFFTFSKKNWLYAIIFLGLSVYQIKLLIEYLDRSNENIASFLDSIQFDDLSYSFKTASDDPAVKRLHQELNEAMLKLRNSRREKDSEFLFFKNIVMHVGIGLIVFKEDGTIEIFNSAARKLLKLNRAEKLNDLREVSDILVQVFEKLKTGGRELVRLKIGEELVQLSAYAIELNLRGENVKLISIQNIQSELEEKEMEAAKITEEINKTVYKPYKVAYHNPSLPVKENVYSLSAAALTEIEFMDKTYIVTQTKYCVATA